jgi:hypothetical protein
VPGVPEASVEEVIVSWLDAMMEMVRGTDLVWTGLLLSLTVAVKVKVPLAVGVPEISPLLADNASPAGRLPEDTDHL